VKLGFGKYADYDLCEVPESYLRWLAMDTKQRLATYENELTRREMDAEASASWMEKIVRIGFKELAKRHHPDAGGSTRDMQGLNAAYEALSEWTKSE
jgi:Putative quorum-sensing-regulated virulence factor